MYQRLMLDGDTGGLVAKKQTRMGRPPKLEGTMVQITMRVPSEVVELAERITESRIDKPDRSTLLREAMAIGLDTLAARHKIRP